eukprot:FR734905.1.p1 GENE.FR734905.1~~FR734905.1.p1  ORF type:complete len:124 (+),score=6.89 FR734905.1:598-969(+)
MQCQFVQTVPQLTLHALSENVEYELEPLSNLSIFEQQRAARHMVIQVGTGSHVLYRRFGKAISFENPSTRTKTKGCSPNLKGGPWIQGPFEERQTLPLGEGIPNNVHVFKALGSKSKNKNLKI